jgi:hypothetical protein
LDRPEDIFPGYTPKNAIPAPVWTRGIPPAQTSSFYNEKTDNIDVLANRYTQPRIEVSNDPSDVEDRLRSAVVMKRVRIEQFFYDFDKLRKGHVTKSQFSGILSQLNFKLTNQEQEALAQKYETNDPEKFFNYVAFCASINKAFTTTGIEKAPVVRVAPVTQNDTLLARRKYLQSGNGDENDLGHIIEEYRKAVNVRRIHLKPVFQDYDKTKCGHVTKAQFLRVVDLLKISAPENIT